MSLNRIDDPNLLDGIDSIIFDLGGVIINLNFESTLAAFERQGLKNLENFYGSKDQFSFFSDYEMGLITTAEMLEKFQSAYGMQLPIDTFRSCWNALILDLPVERLNFLKQISQSRSIFLLSNINELHLDCVNEKFRDSGFLDILKNDFSAVYFSHLIHTRKPHREIFERVLSENNLQASKTLFIDDSLQHVESAAQLGIRSLHLTKPQDICEMKI